MQVIICSICSKHFPPINSKIKYCSRKCYWQTLKGNSISPETQFKKGSKISKEIIEKMKGRIPWNKDKIFGQILGEKHPQWKGNEASYGSKHRWLTNHASKYSCACCKLTRHETRLTWANISHEYTRSLNDYLPLCYKCHWYFDREERGNCHETLISLLELKH